MRGGRLDPAAQQRQRRRNAAQGLVLLGGMVAMLAVCAWLIAGGSGVVLVLVLGLVLLATRPRIPPERVLALYGGRPLPSTAAPALHRLVAELAERADLPRPPRLHYVPTAMLNAFAVGRRDQAAIGVTDGLLRALPGRELAGVLAHEISHVRNDDLWIMTLADTVGRLTHAMAYAGLFLIVAYAGLFLIVLGLPALAMGPVWPLAVGAVLLLVPTIMTLLQLALSRAREYDADLDAAAITGDPEGLARALQRLDRHEGRIWERILVPHGRSPDGALLRTHPPTAERVRRLRELAPRPPAPLALGAEPFAPRGYRAVAPPVRLRRPGIWW